MHRETEDEREAREHFEFGRRWGATNPYAYYPIPESHLRDPFDPHFDPYAVYERYHREGRPHWTDDDEGFSMDFMGQPRKIYKTKKKTSSEPSSKKSKKKSSKKGGSSDRKKDREYDREYQEEDREGRSQ